MQYRRNPESMPAATVTWWQRLRLLPPHARPLLIALVLLAAAPGAARLYAEVVDPQGSTAASAVARRPGLVGALALAAAAGALLFAERPRSRSPAGYVRQVRERLRAAQDEFDGALRRRLEGEVERCHEVPGDRGPWQ